MRFSCGLLVLCVVLAPMHVACAQQAVASDTAKNATDSPQPAKSGDANIVITPDAKRSWTSQLLRNFAGDQVAIWSSPKNVRLEDTAWLFPLAGVTAGMFVTDTDYSRHNVSSNPKTLSHYSSLSNYAVFGMAGGAGAMWLLGYANHNEHWRETGFLAGEAAANSFAVTEALKYSMRRERPFVNNSSGNFFQSGGDSFPSEHSAAAWSIAGVVAHEYPGPLTKLLAYGAATLVSYSRVKAHQHFPSDVMVGALVGELSAYQVYSRHHDPELGGDVLSGPASFFYAGEGQSKQGFVGSPYVPLDSWIYPVLGRLSAMGLIDTAFAGMRPWTRLACAQMVSEAQDRADAYGPAINSLVSVLQKEFTPELGGGADRGETLARLESVYFRGENISGQPLTDGYHFAQTQINDYGRPYSEGWNSITGFSAYSSSGPWSGYVRGEMQTASAIPALPLAARQFAGNVDGIPVAPGIPTPSVQQFQLIEGYVGLTMSDWQFSFGRQSLDWGPGEGGSLMFSGNAAPIDMFRVNRVTPLDIPLVSRFLGPMRLEFFLGQLDGYHFVGGINGEAVGSFSKPLSRQPFIQGQRFSFKPTRNFEFGFSHTAVMGGPGIPLTFGTLKDALLNQGKNSTGGLDLNGDGRSGIDWSYRLPLLRNWATFYGDAFNDDQPSPIAYWDRAAIRGGLYFSHIPKVQKLDFRVEGVYTDVPAGGKICCGFFYSNDQFRNGYTSDGFLLGSWIGRDGQGAQAWTNYWFTPKNRLQVHFRHQKVSQQFVPGGGTLTDIGTRADYWIRQGIGVSASVQYEKWLFPIIQSGAQTNVATSIGIQFQPQTIFKPSSLHGVRGSLAEPGGSH